MNKFNEYPKVLHHPNHAAAVWKKLPGEGKGLFEPDTICTVPEKFPDVTVNTSDQEKYYASRGYRPNNIPDPEAYEQALLESSPGAGYVNHDYPRWMYHALQIPVIVQNATEEKALGEDWSRSPIIATEDDLMEQDPEPIVQPVPVKAAKPSKQNRAQHGK